MAACTSDSEPEVSSTPKLPRGGTLRVASPFEPGIPGHITNGPALDPQKDYWNDSFELFRCCLLRTLLSHNGRPTGEGGAVLRPDLAVALPEVAADGMTWTFRIRPGIRYAPPFQDTEIVAADFIRALERTADPKASKGGYSFYYSVIAGFDEYAAGSADSISGLEAPDDHTLVVRLTRAQGDVGNLFTFAATAPLPEGAADGHEDNYGSFLVASGPYMIEGSENLDFSLPPAKQPPVSGYLPAKSITLVRNPSWRAATDALRPAHVDRIEVALGGGRVRLAEQVAEGRLDMQLFTGPPPQEPPDLVEAFLADPDREDQVIVNSRDSIRFIPMNIAQPPFDDIHVRKAVNFAVDKLALREIRGGATTGDVTGHVVINSLENNLLLNYDPYATRESRGNLARAKDEMRLSAYDRNKDGVCDDPDCRSVLTLSFTDDPLIPWESMARSVARDLAPLGIDLDIHAVEDTFTRIANPNAKIPMSIGPAYIKDLLNGSGFVTPLFSSDAIGVTNYSLVGATPEQLKEWGYSVNSVPSIDTKIAQCQATLGAAQFECWAEADRQLMERVVPWVPYIEENRVQLISDRIVAFSFDQFGNLPALDRIALQPGSD